MRDTIGQPVESLLSNSFALCILEASVHGSALVDERAVVRHINPNGATILGVSPAADAIGRRIDELMDLDVTYDNSSATIQSAVVHRPDGDRPVEYTVRCVSDVSASMWVVNFWDVTVTKQQERHLNTFARTASSITLGQSAPSVLHLIAAQVLAGTGVVACSAMLVDLKNRTLQAGTAGEYPDDYAERVHVSWDRGAPLTFIEAITSRKTIVGRHFRRAVTADPRFESFPAWTLPRDWDTNVTVPMIVRGKVLGVLTCAYLEGHDPGDDDVAFLNAMADQAAIAVDNALLIAELEANATLEERHRIARELHDSVSQALFSLALQARACEMINNRGGAVENSPLTQGLREIRDLTQGALAEMRSLIFELRPSAVQEEGLIAAVSRHAHAITSRLGLAIRVGGTCDDENLKQDAANDLFRIAQEALANVVKHADAASVVITIESDSVDDELRMAITDDGRGFDVECQKPGHYGLSNMQERAQRHCGSLVIASRPGRTTIEVRIPEDVVRGSRLDTV